MTSQYASVQSFTTKLTSSSTSYTYVTCYVAPTLPITASASTTSSDVTEEVTSHRHQATPGPRSSRSEDPDEFDPSTQPDMAIIPASIGLTAMTALALSMVGIIILDSGALKRDTRKLLRNVRHLCRKVKSRKVHSEIGAGRRGAATADPELQELADKAWWLSERYDDLGNGFSL